MTESSVMAVQFSLQDAPPEWELPEVPVPESPEHDAFARYLTSLLTAWLERTGGPGAVCRNLAIRWSARNPRVGVDPDVCWIDVLPAGWGTHEIDSLRLWQPGHHAPRLAIEIVSRNHPYKDYLRVQDKYAAIGVQELWVYDAHEYGPKSAGRPVLLQVWCRTGQSLVRRHFSDEPAQSPLLGAWLIPQSGSCLRLADDREGRSCWLTRTEQERARADRERARADRHLARAQELEAEVLRLREQLKRGSRP